jgi:hypothetical protein
MACRNILVFVCMLRRLLMREDRTILDEHFGSWALSGNVLVIPEIQLTVCNELNGRFIVEIDNKRKGTTISD